MKIFHILIVLFLLLTGFTGQASEKDFFDVSALEQTSDEFSSDFSELSESFLPTPGFGRDSIPVLFLKTEQFNFQSAYTEAIARSHFRLYANIIPGLDIPDIIFPFHSRL